MLDLAAEFEAIVGALAREGVEYAVCGGFAMAIHGYPRATVDIDLLIRPEDEERVYAAVEPLGFTFRGRPMHFDGGAMEIRRVSKVDRGEDALVLDLLLVTEDSIDVWSSREKIEWEGGVVSVVSREGLIKLKSGRMSGTDMDDIRKLRDD